MKKLCIQGFKISAIDKKAIEHYMVVSANRWSSDALVGMVNKAVKTIMRDWYEVYKAKQEDSVSADLSIVIPAILSMPEFKPYNTPHPALPVIARKEAVSEEIWIDGFDVEDYEEAALKAFYVDPESQLQWFMTNKVQRRREAFVKEHQDAMMKDPEVSSIPAKQDDFITLVCGKAGYKNRAIRDAEAEAEMLAK